MEKVDILVPPAFEKSGKTKTLQRAWRDEDWIGTFNLWIIQSKPVPAVVYQQRSPNSSWAPEKLDVTAGGHYRAGEKILDGLREVREELGKQYKMSDLIHLGRKINVSPDIKGRMRQNVVNIFMVLDNSPLESYRLEEAEVYAICVCPIAQLIKVHTQKGYGFEAKGITNKGERVKIKVTQSAFPYNWDNYHFKIALLTERFLKGEKHLIY